MNKKLVVLLAVVLAFACVFTACNNNKKDPGKANVTEGGLTSLTTLVTYAVSETQYQYITGTDGAPVTVAVTDADGATHYYIQAVKPDEQSAQSSTEAPATVTVTDAQGEPVMVTNVEGSSVIATETVPTTAGSTPSAPAAANTELVPVTENKAVDRFIDMLNSGTFGIYGTMSSDGETIPMTFIKDGSDVRMSAQLSGIEMDLASLDGKIYLISNSKKSYIEMTDSIMNSLGLDLDDMSLDFGQISNSGGLVEDDAQYNGKAVKTYTSTSQEGFMKFYVDNDDLVKLEMYDPQGRCTTMIEPTQIKGKDQLTAADLAIPEDYEKKSYVSFIADIMGDMENN